MSTEENKVMNRRAYEEGLNQRNLAIFDELCTADFVAHPSSRTIQGLQAYKQFLSMYLTAFPDLHFTIEDEIAEGDKVVVRYTVRGTHQGDLMGIPPTGKQVTQIGMTIVRFANGKGVEIWLNADDLGMLQQIGTLPLLEQAR